MTRAGGMWGWPGGAEGALVEHPAVVEAGVVGAADRVELVKPLAFVVLARDRAPAQRTRAVSRARPGRPRPRRPPRPPPGARRARPRLPPATPTSRLPWSCRPRPRRPRTSRPRRA